MKKRNKQHAKLRSKPSFLHWRFVVLVSVIVVVFSGLVSRAAYIQVVDPDLLIERGDNRIVRTKNVPVHRGMIVDRHGNELAVSVPVQAIYADPKQIHESGALEDTRRWQALADVLGRSLENITKRLKNPKRRFIYIERQVSPAMANYVKQLKLPGIYLRDESRRYYPAGEVSAHIIGFTDVDDKGIEGIERVYNNVLTGTPGSRKIRKDAKGRQVEIITQTAATKPKNIQLTIDQRIQTLAYTELKKAVHYYQATSGSAVIVDIHTGEILAMANSPSYNPNNRSTVKPHRTRNRAITDAYEPGSAAKPLAVLSALEFGSFNVEDVIDTSPGYASVGGGRVKDPRNYGKLDLTGIVRKSSNVGTAKLVESVPEEHFINTYYNMGLVGSSGVNLIGESQGLFRDGRSWSEFELATLSFGYGIAVTPVQLARMYSILGNGGINRPLSIIRQASPEEGERVIDQSNASAVLSMLETVVLDGGTAPKARVPGYRVAGKTGTSRKAVAGGYGTDYVNTFAGVAPVSNPQVAVVVLINEPAGDLYHAGDTAAPLFSNIMSGTLQLLNIAPDDKPVSLLAERVTTITRETD